MLVATTIHVARPNSKQHGALAVLAGQRFLVEDEDSTIRQFRQHAVRRHVAVSLGFIPHDIPASSPVGLANPRQAQRALLRSASVLVLRLHQSTDETRKRVDEDATTAVVVGAGASTQRSYQHCTSVVQKDTVAGAGPSRKINPTLRQAMVLLLLLLVLLPVTPVDAQRDPANSRSMTPPVNNQRGADES